MQLDVATRIQFEFFRALFIYYVVMCMGTLTYVLVLGSKNYRYDVYAIFFTIILLVVFCFFLACVVYVVSIAFQSEMQNRIWVKLSFIMLHFFVLGAICVWIANILLRWLLYW